MTNTFVVAQHNSEGRLILAVCDKEVHGKKLEDKRAMLDLGSKFYHGEGKNAEETAKLIEKAYVVNVVGEEAVKLVVKLGLAKKEAAKTISGVPHMQALML